MQHFTRDDYLDGMVDQYAETLLWSELDDDGSPLLDRFGIEDLPSDVHTQICNDCAAFFDENWQRLEDVMPDSAGHNFVLSRNGHGSGFFDTPYSHADELQASAKSYGAFGLYVGDDGQLYSHN